MATKVLLDTDIGSDVDDAVCLVYLLAQPECDLLGITTVTGEPVKRAAIASAICRAAGKRVPVYPGLATPLLVEQKQKHAEQAEALDRWAHDINFPEAQAVSFLRDTIRANPGEVTLLAIGPLTNIGLLFALDPDIPGLLKGLVLMAGIYSTRTANIGPLEWNIKGDPHAAAIVYSRQVALHRSVGSDVTSRVSMPADEVRHRYTAPLLLPVLDFAEIWFRKKPAVVYHDALAAAVIFDPQICRYQRGIVEIDTNSPRLLGFSHFTSDENGPHQVAVDADQDRFYRHFFSVVEAYRPG